MYQSRKWESGRHKKRVQMEAQKDTDSTQGFHRKDYPLRPSQSPPPHPVSYESVAGGRGGGGGGGGHWAQKKAAPRPRGERGGPTSRPPPPLS
eukprot:COSAG05_NODE_258_length_12741_cov_168.778279_1_plen_92_part_10